MRIGYAGKQYPEVRNIIDKIDGQNYVFCRDIYSIIRKLFLSTKLALNNRFLNNAEFAFSDFGYNSVDIIHFFNTVSFSSKPWIVTFETVVPRFRGMLDWHKYGRRDIAHDQWILKAMKSMAAPNCKAIIAISHCAANMQRDALAAFPIYNDAISKKITVLHPPQKVLLNPDFAKAKPSTPSLTLMLIGHQFFSKGGKEILSAASFLRETENADINIILVSRILSDSYATNTTQEDVTNIKKTLLENSSWIKWHEVLPHAKVIELIHKCDIGLLPSYTETYGYSVLEFQACGIPVITTDIRAFPEINNQEAGWIINIPKHADGESACQGADGIKRASAAIEKGLIDALREAISTPELIKQKGRAALQRVLDHHSPEQYAEKLLRIYEGR